MQAGVRSGMRCGGVATIAPGTIMLDREPEKEARALDAIALAMLQFTPDVAFTENFTVLLDVGPSLRLFGGPLALCHQVRSSIRRLGFTASLGAAPTAQGAWLLAHAPHQRRPPHRRCLQLATMTPRLDRLPCGIMPAAQPFLGWFDGIGAVDLGALRRLPRTGLLRRTSKQLIRVLDHAYGDLDEMQRWMAVTVGHLLNLPSTALTEGLLGFGQLAGQSSSDRYAGRFARHGRQWLAGIAFVGGGDRSCSVYSVRIRRHSLDADRGLIYLRSGVREWCGRNLGAGKCRIHRP